MSNKSQHARQENCSSGLLAYDGGVVDLSTQDIWVLCENPNCEAPGCHGPLAGDTSPDYVDFGPKAMRVRHVSDLKKHSSGNDVDYGITCLVSPKEHFKSDRPDPKTFKKGSLDSEVRRGSISLSQSTETTKFPTGGRARTWRVGVASLLEATDFSSPDSNKRRRHILLANLSRLTADNGIDAVIDAFPEDVDGSNLSVAISLANERLAQRRNALRVEDREDHDIDRNAGQPVAQPVKASHDAKPSKALFQVAPRTGEAVGDRFLVKLDTGHFAFRFLDRGLGAVNPNSVDAIEKLSPSNLKGVEKVVNNFVKDTVFTHFVDPKKQNDPKYLARSVLDESKRSASTKHQAQVANRCEVRAPHPSLPDQDLIIILEIAGQAKVNGETKWVVNPRTCIRVPRNKDFSEEMSYGDTKVSTSRATEIEEALQKTIDSQR